MHSPPNTLQYNVFWMERTFSSRSATEALLAPERDAGNLCSHDYEAATKFLPGFHRYYDTAGMTAGMSLAYTLRRPKWTQPRVATFVLFGAVAGHIIGRLWEFRAHLAFIHSIRSPAGFSQAMDNIQKKIGMPSVKGPVIVRSFEDSSIHSGNSEQENAFGAVQDTPVPQPVAASSSEPMPSARPTQSSRWETIRAANARTASNSSWDALRQQHERAKVPSSSGATNHSNFPLPDERANDRAAEQAEFDALVEKERNMKE